MRQIFSGVWIEKDKILTKNLVLSFRSFTEKMISIKGYEYRIWDPYRSKPAAAISNGLKTFPVKQGLKILYLGAAQGFTPSFFSDIIGKDGVIYAVEISPRAFNDLNPVAEKRGNIVPILADARKPHDYEWIEDVDLLYQDVATPDQSEIIIRNAKHYLKPKGFAMIAIKSRSINVVKKPREVYKQEIETLVSYFKILEKVELDPYEKDHLFVVMRKK